MNDLSEFQPRGLWLEVSVPRFEAVTESGIYLPEQQGDNCLYAEVEAIGGGLPSSPGLGLGCRIWEFNKRPCLISPYALREVRCAQIKVRRGYVHLDDLIAVGPRLDDDAVPTCEEWEPANDWVKVVPLAADLETHGAGVSLARAQTYTNRPAVGLLAASGPGRLQTSGPLRSHRISVGHRMLGLPVERGADAAIHLPGVMVLWESGSRALSYAYNGEQCLFIQYGDLLGYVVGDDSDSPDTSGVRFQRHDLAGDLDRWFRLEEIG